jgi:small subunit ribosomal protein S1
MSINNDTKSASPAVSAASSPSMMDLMKHVGTKNEINVGDKIKGKILNIAKSELLLDIENIGLAIIRGKETYNEEYLAHLKVGEIAEAVVIGLDNNLNCIEASFKAIGKDKMWSELNKAFEAKQTVEAKIREANRGGFIVRVMGVEGFLPASQLAPAHAVKSISGEDKSLLNQMKKYVGQTFNVKIIGVNPDNESIVVSEKAVSEEISNLKLSKYKVGDTVDAHIVGVVDFGVFLRFDEDLEGLVHISEIAWKKIEDIKKELQIGNKVKAKIIDIDQDNRINLSIKQTIPNPWIEFAKGCKTGDEFEGTITKIVGSGAVVLNSDDIQGFCHISQISETPIDTPSKIHEHLKNGQTKKFTVLDVQEDKLVLTLLLLEVALNIFETQKKLEKKVETNETKEA